MGRRVRGGGQLMRLMFGLLLAAAVLLAAPTPSVQAVNFGYVIGIGNPGRYAGGSGVAIDAAGNTYWVGYVAGVVDFDPGPGVVNIGANTMSSYGATQSGYLIKRDASGALVWAHGCGESTASSVAVDATGNVYVAGAFRDTIDLDPGAGVFSRTAVGVSDVFIAKFTPAGEFVWGRTFGGPDWDNVARITVDAAGWVYVAGWYVQSASFDAGPEASPTLQIGNAYVTLSAFAARLDTNGTVSWAVPFNSPSASWAIGVVSDSNGVTPHVRRSGLTGRRVSPGFVRLPARWRARDWSG